MDPWPLKTIVASRCFICPEDGINAQRKESQFTSLEINRIYMTARDGRLGLLFMLSKVSEFSANNEEIRPQ